MEIIPSQLSIAKLYISAIVLPQWLDFPLHFLPRLYDLPRPGRSRNSSSLDGPSKSFQGTSVPRWPCCKAPRSSLGRPVAGQMYVTCMHFGSQCVPGLAGQAPPSTPATSTMVFKHQTEGHSGDREGSYLAPLKDRPGFDDLEGASFRALFVIGCFSWLQRHVRRDVRSTEANGAGQRGESLLGGNCEAEEERQERLFIASRKEAPWKNTKRRINDYSPCL